MSRSERAPKPGSKMAIVLGHLQQGETGFTLPEVAGWSSKDVIAVINNLQSRGYIAIDPEERRQERRERHRRNSGSIWPSVAPYAFMRMTSVEIKEAAVLEGEGDYSIHQIQTTVKNGKKTDEVRPFSPEEREDIRKDERKSVRHRVDLWLRVGKILQDADLEDHSMSRGEWKLLIADYATHHAVERQLPERLDRINRLLVRGAIVSDITQVLGGERSTIKNILSGARRRGYLQKPDGEEISRIRKKAREISLKPDRDSKEQQCSNTFAGKLLEAGLLPAHRDNWNALQNLFTSGDNEVPIELPDDFSAQLRLEVFFVASAGAILRGKLGMLQKYRDIGREIAPRWFQQSLQVEESFIEEKIRAKAKRKPQTIWIRPQGVNLDTDGEGYTIHDTNGHQSKTTNGNETIVYKRETEDT